MKFNPEKVPVISLKNAVTIISHANYRRPVVTLPLTAISLMAKSMTRTGEQEEIEA